MVFRVLHVVPVNAEGRQSFLCMSRQYGSQIDGSRAFRPVKSPNGFGPVGVHVHRLGTVTPARGYRNGGTHAGTFELVGAGRAFRHSSDGAVCKDTFDGSAVFILQVFRYQIGYGLRQSHRLVFKTFAYAALPTVYGGAYTNLRMFHVMMIS